MVILIVFGCFLFVWEQGFDLYVTPTISQANNKCGLWGGAGGAFLNPSPTYPKDIMIRFKVLRGGEVEIHPTNSIHPHNNQLFAPTQIDNTKKRIKNENEQNVWNNNFHNKTIILDLG